MTILKSLVKNLCGLTAFAVVLWIFSFAGHAAAPPPSVCQFAWENPNEAELVSPAALQKSLSRSAWHTKEHAHGGVRQVRIPKDKERRRVHYRSGDDYGLEAAAVGFLIGAAFF